MNDTWSRKELRHAHEILLRALTEADKLQEDTRSHAEYSSRVDDRVQVFRGHVRYALEKTAAIANLADTPMQNSSANPNTFHSEWPKLTWPSKLMESSETVASSSEVGQTKALEKKLCGTTSDAKQESDPRQPPKQMLLGTDGTADAAAGCPLVVTQPSPPGRTTSGVRTTVRRDGRQVVAQGPGASRFAGMTTDRHFSLCLDDEDSFFITSDIEGMYEFRLPSSRSSSRQSRSASDTSEVAREFQQALQRSSPSTQNSHPFHRNTTELVDQGFIEGSDNHVGNQKIANYTFAQCQARADRMDESSSSPQCDRHRKSDVVANGQLFVNALINQQDTTSAVLPNHCQQIVFAETASNGQPFASLAAGNCNILSSSRERAGGKIPEFGLPKSPGSTCDDNGSPEPTCRRGSSFGSRNGSETIELESAPISIDSPLSGPCSPARERRHQERALRETGGSIPEIQERCHSFQFSSPERSKGSGSPNILGGLVPVNHGDSGDSSNRLSPGGPNGSNKLPATSSSIITGSGDLSSWQRGPCIAADDRVHINAALNSTCSFPLGVSNTCKSIPEHIVLDVATLSNTSGHAVLGHAVCDSSNTAANGSADLSAKVISDVLDPSVDVVACLDFGSSPVQRGNQQRSTTMSPSMGQPEAKDNVHMHCEQSIEAPPNSWPNHPTEVDQLCRGSGHYGKALIGAFVASSTLAHRDSDSVSTPLCAHSKDVESPHGQDKCDIAKHARNTSILGNGLSNSNVGGPCLPARMSSSSSQHYEQCGRATNLNTYSLAEESVGVLRTSMSPSNASSPQHQPTCHDGNSRHTHQRLYSGDRTPNCDLDRVCGSVVDSRALVEIDVIPSLGSQLAEDIYTAGASNRRSSHDVKSSCLSSKMPVPHPRGEQDPDLSSKSGESALCDRLPFQTLGAKSFGNRQLGHGCREDAYESAFGSGLETPSFALTELSSPRPVTHTNHMSEHVNPHTKGNNGNTGRIAKCSPRIEGVDCTSTPHIPIPTPIPSSPVCASTVKEFGSRAPSNFSADGVGIASHSGLASCSGNSTVGHSNASSGDEGPPDDFKPMKARVAMLEELLKRGEAARGGGKITASTLASLNEDMCAHRSEQRLMSWPLVRNKGLVDPFMNEANINFIRSGATGENGNFSCIAGSGGCVNGNGGLATSDSSGGVGVGVAVGNGGGNGSDSLGTRPPKAKTPEPPLSSVPKGKGKGVPPKAPPKAPPAKAGGTDPKGPRPRKADVKPRTSMKKLFWSSFVLDEDMSLCRSTIWGAIDEDGLDEFNTHHLEELFSENPAGRNSRFFGEGSATQRKAKARVRVFEESRRRQVCVMCARLPGVDETVQAVLEMDDVRLNRDQVELLLANAPTTEELAALRSTAAETEHDSDEPLDWDDAEAFILRLSGVPSFALRLQIWVFENSFDERFDIFQRAACDVCSACMALQASAAIQHLLGLALAVGNYLNAGTSRGRADGFTVETLAQMRTVKASKPGRVMTLVDYIVEELQSSRPGELDLLFVEGGEAELVRNASRHKLADLNVELSAYIAQADGLVKRTASSRDDELDIRSMRVESRLRELGELKKLYAGADEEYQKLCMWFHEGQRHKRERPSDEFFALWDGFLKAVRVALETASGGKSRKSMSQCHRSLQRLKRSLSSADVNSNCFAQGDTVDETPKGKSEESDFLKRRETAPALVLQ